MSGGYIRNAAVRAVHRAAAAGRPLCHDDVIRAIATEYQEAGRIGDAGQLE